ncbi:hypothetical protein EG329_007933 [Mollisiaceae sp. DMI_Dod_QoI]|nr:hypothetical protein EG329_007933 [Helotiales sp. DMI_Dod_QoI]
MSGKGKSRSSRKTSGAKSSHGSSSTDPATEMQPTWPAISFLFIVNGLTLNDDPDTNGGVLPRHDEHGAWLPPIYGAGFGELKPGTVFRWENGVISTADDFRWSDGCVYASWSNIPLGLYKAVTMFYCDPFHQFLVADGDASTRDIASADFPGDRWYTINFHHQENLSRVDFAGDERYLAGVGGNCINQLGLGSYQNPEPDSVPLSGGLAGHLTILIGLIAFSCKRQNLDRILIEDQAWLNYQWNSHSRNHGRMYLYLYVGPKEAWWFPYSLIPTTLMGRMRGLSGSWNGMEVPSYISASSDAPYIRNSDIYIRLIPDAIPHGGVAFGGFPLNIHQDPTKLLPFNHYTTSVPSLKMAYAFDAFTSMSLLLLES